MGGRDWFNGTSNGLVRPGEIVDGKFRVERVLGEGGMGIVVAATHLKLEQLVAMKIIRPEALANREIVARFLREARTAARLRGEHVARVIDVGETQNGFPYIVMEHLQGQDLAGVLAERGRIPVPEAVEYLLQACEAVAEAHALGIVHRDLKPANLFLSQAAHRKHLVKVLDFGIAKTSSLDGAMTQTTAVIGSPGYMSPEQLRSSKDVDGRTDIWSLGIVLWEMVTGTSPFKGDTLTEICLRIVADPLPPLPAFPGLGPELDQVLRRMLEKDRARRYRTVEEVVAALRPFAGETRAPRSTLRHAAAEVVRAPGPPPGARRWIALASLVGVLLAAGAGLVVRGTHAPLARSTQTSGPPVAVPPAPPRVREVPVRLPVVPAAAREPEGAFPAEELWLGMFFGAVSGLTEAPKQPPRVRTPVPRGGPVLLETRK